MDVSIQEYLYGDKHDPTEREKEMLQGVRTVLDYAEKLQQARDYIDRNGKHYPEQMEKAEEAGKRVERLFDLNEQLRAKALEVEKLQSVMQTMMQQRDLEAAADRYHEENP